MHDKLKEILAEKEREVEKLREGISPFDGEMPLSLAISEKASAGKTGPRSLPKSSSPLLPRASSAGKRILHHRPDLRGVRGRGHFTHHGQDLFRRGPVLVATLKKAVDLPVLRKDFIIDELQIMESVARGADAVLLIARILTPDRLSSLLSLCGETGLSALTEVHDREDLQKAMDCGADIIGINNRDLDTFHVDLETTRTLAPFVPDHCLLVSESGIRHAGTIRSLSGLRINAFLVGSAIMASPSMSRTLRELVEAAEKSDGQG